MKACLTWFLALRPAYFLISLTTFLMATALPIKNGTFQLDIAILTLLVTLLLQSTSNLSNDLGDYLKGTDIQEERLGPSQSLQEGKVSIKGMKRAIVIVVMLAMIVGGILLYRMAKLFPSSMILIAFLLGIGGIIAAITYTLGKKPYGYAGLGDPSAFLFFGPVAVIGIYLLHTGEFHFEPILPAIFTGAITAAILNVNNIRDIDNDTASGKITIAARLGHYKSRGYHFLINGVAIVSILLYISLYTNIQVQMIILPTLIPLMFFPYSIAQTKSERLDPWLAMTVGYNTLFAALFFTLLTTIEIHN